jgi:hypothetical protein
MVRSAPKEDLMQRLRTSSKVSGSVHRQLNSYALAASAAGVGVLSLVQPAEGRIVYTNTYKKIVNGLPIDLNRDGIADFSLSFSRQTNGDGSWTIYLQAVPADTNQVVVASTRGRYASDLPSGVKIDSQQKFASRPRNMATLGYSHGTSACFGPWVDKKRYLGFKFDIKDRRTMAGPGWAFGAIKSSAMGKSSAISEATPTRPSPTSRS